MKIQSGNSITPGPCDTFYLSYETLFKTSISNKRSNSRSAACRLTGWNQGVTDCSVRTVGGGGGWGLFRGDGRVDYTDHILQHMCPGMRSQSRHQIFHYRLKWPWTFQAPLFPYTESLEGSRLAHFGRMCAGMVVRVTPSWHKFSGIK